MAFCFRFVCALLAAGTVVCASAGTMPHKTDTAVAAPGSISPPPLDAYLTQRQLIVPVAGLAPAQLRDTYAEKRGERAHEALDIMAPRGTRVLAVDDGRVVKLFNSVPGGITLYQSDPANQVVYYYAHLDGYAEGVREGMQVRKGDLIGYVGSTGNASPDAPHLHFTIMRLPPGKEWWKGESLNPFPYLTQIAP